MKANLPQREPTTLDWWESIDVYRRIRESRADAPPYVLHDGPPYANGHIHLGHALNKILKDIVVKSRTMSGHDARYVPGWDCHGLPIEHHIDRKLGSRKAEMSPLQFRNRCREYAENFIEIQSKEFHRIGVMWDRGQAAVEDAEGAVSRRAIYRTIDHTYEAEIVRQLGRFFEKGAVYHGVKPVHWCPSCRTALAEAEVEYEDRDDPSVYVAFPVTGLEKRIEALAGRDVSLLIWTTTPWTLPANLAVALGPTLDYVAVEAGGRTFIVADGLLVQVTTALGWSDPQVVARFSGAELVGEKEAWIGRDAPVSRPYYAPSGAASEDGVLILGDHVTLEAGTGCVHTAPGHGAEDFVVGQQYDLEVFNPVDDAGRFLPDRVGLDWLAGAFVLDANPRIVEDLRERGLLLHDEVYHHSYPHCWRCKSPVLFRSTPQWFISMDAAGLREAAVAQVHKTRWIPEAGQARIAQMIETRPDWCISRQRSWGVPIPAVVCTNCEGENETCFVRDPAFFEHIARLFLEEGSNSWFGAPDGAGGHRPYTSKEERLARLVPEGISCPGCGEREGLTLHEHIVDVWFESGVSHSAVLNRDPRLPWPADLYLEGHDQYRGWFHSSLLVAVNDRDVAPYRTVLTHGFTMDSEGRKMSKTLGNVISPLDVVKKRGAEILRLWVSMVDFLEDIRLSEETLDRNAEAYRKIRNTFRYLLGNLHGFDPSADCVPYTEMEELDRWALQRLEQLRLRILGGYEGFQHHVVYHALHQFCSVTMSSFYLDILKDRLYTFAPEDPARRSAQTTLWRIARDLCRLMAPVLSFTSDEIWQEFEKLHGREAWKASSVHTERFPDPLEVPVDQAMLERWERFGAIREETNKALELARADKLIGTSMAATVVLQTPDEETAEFLRSFGSDLHFLFITSGVELGDAGADAFRSEALPGLRVRVRPAEGEKCGRCWHFTTDVGSDERWPEVCGRCAINVRKIVADAEPA